MKKAEIQKKMDELKSDYIRFQGDMEKLESLGKHSNVAYSEKLLEEIEAELKRLREKLQQTES